MSSVKSGTQRRIGCNVYVDVPRPPYPINSFRYPPMKENRDALVVSCRKRIIESEHDVCSSPTKKSKVSDSSPLLERVLAPLSNASPEYPNGYVYCHQCARKRDVVDSIPCTISFGKQQGVTSMDRVCSAKFCRTCLKRRYGENLDTLKLKGAFLCPKCRNLCNCFRCRKAKGLKPLGNLDHSTRTIIEKESAVQSTQKNFSSSTRPLASSEEDLKSTINPAYPNAPSPKPRVPKKAPVKPSAPRVTWTYLPTVLDFEMAVPRFQIREFILRFNSIMRPAIPNSQLAELEDLGCELRSKGDELPVWVSEACVRSIILGLLGLLADEAHGVAQKAIASAFSDIRRTGVNLNKIWTILAKLRTEFNSITKPKSDVCVIYIPNPLKPPSSYPSYETRRTRSARESDVGSDNLTPIVHPAQLVPVVEALVEAACSMDSIRGELERGGQEAKDLGREVKDWIKSENERWDAERKEFEDSVKDKGKVKGYTLPMKIKREVHKFQVRSMENALKLAAADFALRFLPLGSDSEGRQYWALSPGIRERKDALDFIKSMTSNKYRMKGGVLKESTRRAMKEWAWCIVVWGTAPVGSRKILMEKKNENSEGWWGFYEPDEIRKLATWVGFDANTDGDYEEGSSRFGSLARRLKEYAGLLEWRVQEDKYQ